MTIYAITVIVILCVIVSENRNPVKSLAWVTVLILLPLVGVVLYLFFGRSIKNTRMISRRNRRRLRRAERTALSEANERMLSPEARQQIRLAKSLESAEYYPGNDIKVYTDGASKFEALIDDLSKAKRYINLQYYIILDDEIGTRVADVLIERARAGVAVHVIYDNVGSLNTHRRYFKRMRAAGIEVYPFFKVSFPPFGTRINWRNHRKICVIDGEVGYIGGMNIADRYITGAKILTVGATRICGLSVQPWPRCSILLPWTGTLWDSRCWTTVCSKTTRRPEIWVSSLSLPALRRNGVISQ